jgi:hypothetical protein
MVHGHRPRLQNAAIDELGLFHAAGFGLPYPEIQGGD